MGQGATGQGAQGWGPSLGGWRAQGAPPLFGQADLRAAVSRVREPVQIVREVASGRLGVATGGQLTGGQGEGEAYVLHAALPPLYPEWLGNRGFNEEHGTRFAYVAGAMANGIASAELVVAMAQAGMLGFFGAAGLSYERVQQGLDQIQEALGADMRNWGANLIHSPQEPRLEERVAQSFIERGVPKISASAYMRLTPAIVRVAYAGVHVGADGQVVRPRHVFAKISRPEVARHFLQPAPKAMLQDLVQRGWLTEAEAELAARLPVATDITAEADSGGHTDNRPLSALVPEIMALRNEIVAERGYRRAPRVGAAGGLGTPQAVAAAFAMGAAYVLTGSVNQACLEAGLSQAGKVMLANAGMADVIMAPAADMFELGVELQVLRRGTMFGQRAKKLWEIYRTYPGGLDTIPQEERAKLEGKVLGASLQEIWGETRDFWTRRGPEEVERAERDPRHKMALCFRWYLGKSSRWAIVGDGARVFDYQIWCGPAMGAFNTWVKGSFLEPVEARGVVQIALNLMEGAAHITRAQQLRSYGLPIPDEAFDFRPRPLY